MLSPLLPQHLQPERVLAFRRIINMNTDDETKFWHAFFCLFVVFKIIYLVNTFLSTTVSALEVWLQEETQ